MAITVTDSNNRRNDAEATTNWASDGGGGAGPQDEPDLVYQNTQAVSRKMGTTLGGFAFTDPTPVDVTVAADSVAMLKGVWSNSAALVAAPSAQHKIGSATTDAYRYQIADDGTRGDIDAPPTRLWVISMINPNVAAWRDFIDGTPVLTTVDVWGIQSDFNATSKSENVAMDAIDLSPGLFLVGSSPDGNIDDFKAYDEDTQANRFGHYVSIGGTVFLQGVFVIGRNATGTSTLTEFTDANRIIEFPGGRVDEGDNGMEYDLDTSGTTISVSATILTGAGRSGPKIYFDASQLSTGADTIEVPGHPFLTGDTVVYSNEGGTNITGLTTTTEYFVRSVDVDNIALYAMANGRNDAYIDGTRINLTVVGSVESQSFTRTPITWPNLTVTGNTGTASFDGSTLNGINIGTLTSATTVTDTVFNALHLLDVDDGATFARNSINLQVTAEGVAVLRTPDPSHIVDCTFNAPAFIQGQGGHAIDIESAAGSPYTFSGNLFNDYGPNPMVFNALNDVDDGNDEIDFTGHPWTTGDAVYYNDRGGTQIVGLTDQDRYYVRSVTANSVSLHPTARAAIDNVSKIAITTGSDEDHALESANAAILNSTGTAVTINIEGGGDTPTVRNTAGSSTIVQNTVTVLVQGVTEGAAIKVIATDTVGAVTTGDTLLEALADLNGEATFSHNYEGDLTVTIRARQQGLPNAAIQDDNGSFTDETSQANSAAGSDMNLLPAAEVATEDRYLFGHAEEFGQLKLDISVASDGGTIVWQYWNGAWTNLGGVSDGTNGFQNTGENIVSWTIPGDWVAMTVNSQGPFKYVRASLTAGSTTVQPLGRKAKLDVTRYIPSTQDNTIVSVGLSSTLSWQEDNISTF